MNISRDSIIHEITILWENKPVNCKFFEDFTINGHVFVVYDFKSAETDLPPFKSIEILADKILEDLSSKNPFANFPNNNFGNMGKAIYLKLRNF